MRRRSGNNPSRVKIGKPPAGSHVLTEFRNQTAIPPENDPTLTAFVKQADRRNFIYGIIALVILMFIFLILEFKQSWEAAAENARLRSQQSASFEKK